MVQTNRSIRAPALRTSARLSAAATPPTRPVVEPPRLAAPSPLFRPASSDDDEDSDTPAVEEQRDEQAGGEGLEAEAEEALHDQGEAQAEAAADEGPGPGPSDGGVVAEPVRVLNRHIYRVWLTSLDRHLKLWRLLPTASCKARGRISARPLLQAWPW